MKKLLCTVALTLCLGYLSAQNTRIDTTEVYQDEYFHLNCGYGQAINYKFYAGDSITLDEGFFRGNFNGQYYYTMDLVVDGMGVYPPSAGEQGGPNEGDNGYVGALGGTVDVGALGGATYTIPIELPTGINGMQPSLDLVYNSQGGNGLLGWKWDLAGLSSITRTGQTRYHDGSVGGVTLNDFTDRFMLDGQRLITVASYEDSMEFKLEQDDMSRIRAYYELKNLGHFVVWKADGTIVEYGRTTDSRILPQNGQLAVVGWLVNKVSDRYGNAILFEYNTNQQTGEHYISQILYTRNEALSIKPEFEVDFVYSNTNRLDYDFKYVGGNLLQQKKNIEQIKVSRVEDSELLEQYTFEYGSNNLHFWYDSVQMRTRLEKIHYQKGGKALNPTSICWTSYGDNNVIEHWDIEDSTIYNNFPFVGDFNADGYSDLVVVPFKGDTMYYNHLVTPRFFLNNKSQGFNLAEIPIDTLPNTLDWIYVVDINDDGYDDLVTVCYDSISSLGRTDIMVYKNIHSQSGISFEPAWQQPLSLNCKVKTVIGDFLGQGKRSLLVFGISADGNTVTRIVYVTCDGGLCHMYNVDFDIGASILAYQIEAGEYLGDGHTEVFFMGANTSGVWKLLQQNNGFLLSYQFHESQIQFNNDYARSQVFSGDYNGDGLTDLLSYKKENGRNTWTMFFSKGNGFGTPVPCGEFFNIDMPKQELYGQSLRKIKQSGTGTWNSICTSDFDGDGTTDVAVVHNANESYSYLEVYFKYKMDSQGFLSAFKGSFYNGQHYGMYPINCKTQYMHVGNFLGKENCSFIGLRKVSEAPVPHEKLMPRIYRLKSTHDLNNVKSITDGLGNVTSLSYDVLLQEYKNFGYGVRRAAVPIRVLKASTTYNVAGKPVVTHHDFSDPCFHRDGHGFIGFKQITTLTSKNGVYVNKSISEYSLDVMNDYAFLLPSLSITYVFPTSNDDSIKATKTIYHFMKVVNAESSLVTCPALTKKEVKRYNIDTPSAGLLSKEITENDFNYMPDAGGLSATYRNNYDCTETRIGVHNTNVSNVADCDFRTTESNEFDDANTDYWILGRMTKQVVTQSMTGKEDKVSTKVIEYVSDDNYQVSHVIDIPNTEQSHDRLTIKTDYAYYPTGNLKSDTVSAPYGNQNEPQRTKVYEYGEDNKGRLVTKETVRAGGLEYETAYSYDSHDNLDSLVDQNGMSTTYNIDPLGITSRVINPDNTVVGEAYRWAANHRFAPDSASYYNWSRTSGKAKQLTFFHKSGEVLRTVTFGPKDEAIITDIRYNNNGLTESVSNPYFVGDTVQWTKYEYDRMERLVTKHNPDYSRTEIIHQGLVTRIHISDNYGNEHKSKRTDNVMGWTVSNRDAQYVTVNYDYYADGSLAYTQVGDNIDSRISIGYDNRGNRDSLCDPDYGLSSYLYNAYGDLMERTSPKSDVTSYRYDSLGRLVGKYESGDNDTTLFVYDETEGLKGTLKSIRHGNNQSIQYGYDAYLRLVSVSEQLFGTTYETSLEYDIASRISRMTYPTGITVRNGYSVYGHLNSISDEAGHPLWEVDKTNAIGQILQSTMGDNIVTDRRFDSKMHYIKGIVTSNNLQNLSYDYDIFGNLARRTDSLHSMTETFEYDQLNRLTEIYFGNSHCSVRYDNLGRMVSKQALVWKYGGPHVQTVFSSPQFDEEKIHALTEATAHADWFDEDIISINYTSFDKVSRASIGNSVVSFEYGFNEERNRMSESQGAWGRQKTYVSHCECITENTIDAVTQKSWTFLTCPIGVFAVVEKQGDEETLHYILKDHQGSWTVITDAEGNMEQELSYDAWGNLRNPNTWCVDKTIRPMFDRGYTGQEHLNAFGLINMNGRMYDPVMSSFLSVDRYVQQPDNSQSFNRYAYCMYNPLRYVDPSGWLMSRPYGSGTIPPNGAPNKQPVAIDGGYRLAVIDGILYGGCYGDVIVTATGIQSSGSIFEDYPLFSSDRGFGSYDIGGENMQTISEASNYGSGGLGAFWINGYSNNSTTNKTNNVNIDITEGMISTAGLYTYIEKVLAYSETLGKWTDKMGNRRPLTDKGNQFTGGKFKYGKAMSNKFAKASNRLTGLGMIISSVQCYTSTSINDKIMYSADVLFGGIGLLPGGTWISMFWFFGGRELVFQYGNTMVEMMKNGMNPGLPEYQPFK